MNVASALDRSADEGDSTPVYGIHFAKGKVLELAWERQVSYEDAMAFSRKNARLNPNADELQYSEYSISDNQNLPRSLPPLVWVFASGTMLFLAGLVALMIGLFLARELLRDLAFLMLMVGSGLATLSVLRSEDISDQK